MTAVHKTTLDNGLCVVAVEMPHLHSTEIAVYLKVGGRNDPPGKSGLSHFLEHMLFRGTADFPSNLELETAFEAIGGSVNASTDEECTCFYSRIHPDHVAVGLKLFASMLLRPTLPGLAIEQRIVIEEALEDINEQGEQINPHNLASMLLWPGHPLGEPTIGTIETIKSFTDTDLRQHLANHYVPTNTVVVVAGKVSAPAVFSSAAVAFDNWPGSRPSSALSALGAQSSPNSLFVSDSDSQVHLQLIFRGFSRLDPRIMAVRLLRRLLSGGGSSRLHLRLREELGIVYAVDASIAAYEETGAFAIELSTAPVNLSQAISETLHEIRRIVVEPLSAEELARVRDGYLFDLDFSRDSTYEMQVRYGWGELMGLVRNIEDDRDEAKALTPDLLRQTARELFAPGGLNLVVVGKWNAKARAAAEKLLQSYTIA